MEFFDVFDKNRNYLNKIMPRGTTLGENEFNIGVEAWILNSKKELLITQRSSNKSHSNLWECPGGCSIAGENSIQTLKREILEEIGIDISSFNVNCISTHLYKHQFVDIYTFNLDINISKLYLQEEEVQDAKWVSINDFILMVEKGEIVPSVATRYELIKDILFK